MNTPTHPLNSEEAKTRRNQERLHGDHGPISFPSSRLPCSSPRIHLDFPKEEFFFGGFPQSAQALLVEFVARRGCQTWRAFTKTKEKARNPAKTISVGQSR